MKNIIFPKKLVESKWGWIAVLFFAIVFAVITIDNLEWKTLFIIPWLWYAGFTRLRSDYAGRKDRLSKKV
jgi:hypothetical protein